MRRSAILFLSLAFLLSTGCSKVPPGSDKPISSFDDTSTVSQITPSSNSNPDTSNQETGSQKLNSESKTTAQNHSELPKSPDNKVNNGAQNQAPSGEISKRQNEPIAPKQVFTSISLNYNEYISANEPKPYLKGKPIYDVLYSGNRVQIGDTVKFRVDFSPANTDDELLTEVSDNLSYSLSNNILSVKVNSTGKYDVGTVTVSSKKNPLVFARLRLTIDPSGNPLNEFSNILSEYISVLGMNYCPVPVGYTANNPSLSITHFDGAPAWDDKISKQENNWMLKSLQLIDEYKKMGFTKVNFIISPIELGFSASK